MANVFLFTAELEVAAEIIDRSKIVNSKIKSCPVSDVKAYLPLYLVIKQL
jgi:hypothetical protein